MDPSQNSGAPAGETSNAKIQTMPQVTRSKAMHKVFDFLPGCDVLKCNMVCNRWYETEIPTYFKKFNCLNTVVIKVGSAQMMQPNPEEDQRGFELTGGPASYSSNIKKFEFQDGMWGKWIEVEFDDARPTKFDMYCSPQEIFNLGQVHFEEFSETQKIVEMRFRCVTIESDAEQMISGIEGMVLGVREADGKISYRMCYNSQAQQTKYPKKCYRVELGQSESKLVGMQLLQQPSKNLSKFSLGLKLKFAFAQKPGIIEPKLESISNDEFMRSGPIEQKQ